MGAWHHWLDHMHPQPTGFAPTRITNDYPVSTKPRIVAKGEMKGIAA